MLKLSIKGYHPITPTFAIQPFTLRSKARIPVHPGIIHINICSFYEKYIHGLINIEEINRYKISETGSVQISDVELKADRQPIYNQMMDADRLANCI